jgi:redox-sensitive bicupin YhaK (pirin superfamily)
MEDVKLKVIKPENLGYGEFDNGKITEIKPIDFPGGTGEGKRIGPLFYWSWASANGDGVIGMHPHQAFEIMSYGIVGEIGHSDSLNNKTKVGPGGAQLIQAGKGIYHQEEMYGERTDFFQIWFEPNLQETIKDSPFYGQYEHDEFPIEENDEVLIKSIIGKDSPLKIKADVKADDIIIKAGNTVELAISEGRCLAFNVISGKGEVTINNETHKLSSRYYVNVFAHKDSGFKVTASEDDLRIFNINVPTTVDYKLYGE